MISEARTGETPDNSAACFWLLQLWWPCGFLCHCTKIERTYSDLSCSNTPVSDLKWDCINNRYLFKLPNNTQHHVIVFSSYRFLSWWGPCRQEVRIFQLSVGVKESMVESQRMSSVVFISFHGLSCLINFLSCSFHFAIIPFHVAFISFHFAFMSFHLQVRWVSAQTLTLLSYFIIVLVIFWLSFWRLVQVAISGFMNMCIYKLVIVFFLLSFSGPATQWQR